VTELRSFVQYEASHRYRHLTQCLRGCTNLFTVRFILHPSTYGMLPASHPSTSIYASSCTHLRSQLRKRCASDSAAPSDAFPFGRPSSRLGAPLGTCTNKSHQARPYIPIQARTVVASGRTTCKINLAAALVRSGAPVHSNSSSYGSRVLLHAPLLTNWTHASTRSKIRSSAPLTLPNGRQVDLRILGFRV
jgi:hypothetical protein